MPLEVDVVTSWTDIASLIVNTGAAAGTVGALLIAAKAYSRQVDEASRQQASLVDVERGEAEYNKGFKGYRIVNRSDQRVKILNVSVSDRDESMKIIGHLIPIVLLARDSLTIVEVRPESESVPFVGIQFRDAAGQTWFRYNDGILQHNTRLQLLIGKLARKYKIVEKARQAAWDRSMNRRHGI